MEAVRFLRNGLGLLRFNLPRGKVAYFNHRSVFTLSPFSGYFATYEYGFGTVVKENQKYPLVISDVPNSTIKKSFPAFL